MKNLPLQRGPRGGGVRGKALSDRRCAGCRRATETGHSMLEVIERLANEPAAMKCVRFAVQSGRPCRSRRRNCLRRFSPPRSGPLRRTTRRTAEMREKNGFLRPLEPLQGRAQAEFFLKPGVLHHRRATPWSFRRYRGTWISNASCAP